MEPVGLQETVAGCTDAAMIEPDLVRQIRSLTTMDGAHGALPSSSAPSGSLARAPLSPSTIVQQAAAQLPWLGRPRYAALAVDVSMNSRYGASGNWMKPKDT